MKKKHPVHFLIIPIIIVCIMIAVLLRAIDTIGNRMTDFCFENLKASANHLITDFTMAMDCDRAVLDAMASVIAAVGPENREQIRTIMTSFDRAASYVSYVELLEPDDRLLHQDGTVFSADGVLSFKSEAEKGRYISEVSPGVFDPADRVVRHVVPVVRNGKTVAVLYGVISLRTFSDVYKADVCDKKSFVYIEDGDTGEFLIDTRRKNPGNITEFSRHETLPGYAYASMVDDLKNGVGGSLGFVSQDTGRNVYLSYAPMGINNWNIVLAVTEDAAFSEYRAINGSLIKMAVIEVAALLVYAAYAVIYLLHANRRIRREGEEDSVTRIQNRNAFAKRAAGCRNKFFPSIACAYLDINGLHELNNKYGHAVGDEMLREVGNSLKSVFPYKSIYRVGGDEFVILCDGAEAEACRGKLQDAVQQIEGRGYSLSVGFVRRENEIGIERIVGEADARMLKNKREYYAKHDRRGRKRD